MANKVLFLDIDGVLFLGTSNCAGPYDSDILDADCVASLNRIIDKTDCEIVISSSWQNQFTLAQIKEIFAWNHVQKEPAGVTAADDGFVVPSRRPIEIMDWLARAQQFKNWCAVDDMDLHPCLSNFVKCDPSVGLRDRAVVGRVVAMLG